MSEQTHTKTLCQAEKVPLQKGSNTIAYKARAVVLDPNTQRECERNGSRPLLQRDLVQWDSGEGDGERAIGEFIGERIRTTGKVPSVRTIYNFLRGDTPDATFNYVEAYPRCEWLPIIKRVVDKTEVKVEGTYVELLLSDFGPEIQRHRINIVRLNRLAVLWTKAIVNENGFAVDEALRKGVRGKTDKFKAMKKLLEDGDWFATLSKPVFRDGGSNGICTRYWYGKRHPSYKPFRATGWNGVTD